jgi:WD40 repeat protein
LDGKRKRKAAEYDIKTVYSVEPGTNCTNKSKVNISIQFFGIAYSENRAKDQQTLLLTGGEAADEVEGGENRLVAFQVRFQFVCLFLSCCFYLVRNELYQDNNGSKQSMHNMSVISARNPSIGSSSNNNSNSSSSSTALTYQRAANAVPHPQWHAPWQLSAVVSGHLGWVRSIAFDPSNEWFVTGAADRTIKVLVKLLFACIALFKQQ